MDYKKAYEEALERAKAGKPMEEVFPELTESKDERIRKVLIDMVKRETGFTGFPSQGQVLAYLEKQKEQKSVHTAKEMWKEMRLEVYAQASGNRHEPNYSDDSTKMFSLCDIDEIFEKIGNSTVGSQPAEWSEEDEEMLDIVLTMVDCSTVVPHSGGQLHPSENYKKDISIWLKAFRPSWKPSEKQMEILQYVCEESSHPNQDVIPTLRTLYDDLKKLM